MDNQEGWYEFSHNVNVKEFSESFIEPISKVKAEEYPFRTTCYKIDRVWYVLEGHARGEPAPMIYGWTGPRSRTTMRTLPTLSNGSGPIIMGRWGGVHTQTT